MKEDISLTLIPYLETALARVIGSMTGAEFVVAADRGATEEPELVDAITWQQTFSVVEGPSLWIAAGKDLWEALGKATLQAAGIDEVTEEDCRSTWREIVTQTAAGIASALAADLARDVTASKGTEIDEDPTGLAWVAFSVEEGGRVWPFKAAWEQELAALSERQRPEGTTTAAKDPPMSKTFDLLLEVALPVAVSFGRTSLQIREVLKLNTGSIVELDRFVTDPVEVIVNDCVIARGEVVVVDGNYGVRINQLASREERLRSGMAEGMRKGGRR
ncbi:MAG TPA: flagellar motor switch protein FliN [Bryobacteraceae bacterium]|nr:flagellar motor switch protein FliN [Bryobacteraceae bacterium]